VQSLAQLPGVRSVGAVDLLPMTFGGGIPFKIEGRETAPDAGNYYAELRRINPEYFQTLEIPLLKGRFFNADEENEHSYRILIDETLARRFWPDQDPIGKTITIPEWSTNPYQIVGVVGSVKHFGLIGEAPATLYISFLHRPSMTLGFALQTSGNPLSLASSVRERIWAIDPDLPIEQLRTMEEAIADKSTLERFGAVLLMIFSGIALVLAAMGIYGIMAYSISQRTYEIGIRIALGAQVGNVISMVVRSGAILIVIGLLIGLAGAFAVTRILASSLYEVSTTDPVTYITVVFLLTMVSLCACYLPARRAAKVDPMTALRYE
jgi:predicted permease